MVIAELALSTTPLRALSTLEYADNPFIVTSCMPGIVTAPWLPKNWALNVASGAEKKIKLVNVRKQNYCTKLTTNEHLTIRLFFRESQCWKTHTVIRILNYFNFHCKLTIFHLSVQKHRRAFDYKQNCYQRVGEKFGIFTFCLHLPVDNFVRLHVLPILTFLLFRIIDCFLLGSFILKFINDARRLKCLA